MIMKMFGIFDNFNNLMPLTQGDLKLLAKVGKTLPFEDDPHGADMARGYAQMCAAYFEYLLEGDITKKSLEDHLKFCYPDMEAAKQEELMVTLFGTEDEEEKGGEA